MKFLKYFLIIPLFLNAELVIEITKGSDNPYRIALIPFQGESGAAKQANEIVKNDLIRTGEFYIFDEKSLIAYPPSEEDINYAMRRGASSSFSLNMMSLKLAIALKLVSPSFNELANNLGI